MKIFRNISLIGSSHISGNSVNEVTSSIDAIGPDFVCVELDPGRAYSLRHRQKKPKNIELIRHLGLPGFMFYALGGFIQQNLGKIVNIEPGSEMLAAMDAAKKNNSVIVFIDRDIQVTLSRFSRHFKKRELLKMVLSFFTGIFKKEKITFDLTDVPDEKVIEKVMDIAKKEYPSLYMVLVDERDMFMAKHLYFLSKANPEKKILAVVGAGHMRGILSYMQKFSDNEPKIEMPKP